MKIRYFDVKGNQINTPQVPSYEWRSNAKDDKPKDFVMIKQAEIYEVMNDPFGKPFEINKLSEPLEEVYCGWEWDNAWYCVVRMVVKKQVVIIDRRPSGWQFFEQFNQNRPRLT